MMETELNKESLEYKIYEKLQGKEELNQGEALTLLGIGRSNLERLVKENKIPSHKDGKRRFFKKSELEKWIAEKQAERQHKAALREKEKAKRKLESATKNKDKSDKDGHIKNGWYISSRLSQKALDTFSPQNQKMKLLEEMAELQDAILKHLQGRDTDEHVQEEIADVRIVLDQMRMHFGSEGVDRYVQKKVQSLEERIAEHTNASKVKEEISNENELDPTNAKQGELDL